MNKKIQAYSCCPGYVATDMTNHQGHYTIQEGALTPVFLVELPFEVNPDYQGKFFEKSAVSDLEKFEWKWKINIINIWFIKVAFPPQ